VTWPEFLDEYEAKIASTERSLDEGTALDPAVLEEFVPPEGLGKLPEEYVDRTIDLIRQSVEVTQRLETAMGAIQREIARTPARTSQRSPFAETVVPRYFDSAI
jgi:hypothetical protein